MAYATIIPVGKIDEAELIALIDQIKAVTKVDMSIKQQFMVETDDVNVNLMLQSLTQALFEGETTVRSNGHKAKKAAKAKSGMTSHQVRIEETKEILSKQAFNKRLAAGEVSEFTTVTNAKGEQFVVVDGKLVKGPQS